MSLKSNVRELRSDIPLIITAVVTDPDGIDDLIGGHLIDPVGGASYGAFATSASEGAYSITLNWRSIGTVRSIDAPVEGADRALRAEFFDAAGNKAWADAVVTLRCRDNNDSACANQCVDLNTSKAHCGACDASIQDERLCVGGKPTCPSSRPNWCGTCTNLKVDSSNCGTCGNKLQGARTKCVGGLPTCADSKTPDYCASSDKCVDLRTDALNCGACGKTCPNTVGTGGNEATTFCNASGAKPCVYNRRVRLYDRSCDEACRAIDTRLSCLRAFAYEAGDTTAPCSATRSNGRCDCGMSTL